MVDMETIRKNDFGRIQVAVLNPNHIPAHLDIVIGDHYFELEFEVEKIGVDENRYEMEIGWWVEMMMGKGMKKRDLRMMAQNLGILKGRKILVK